MKKLICFLMLCFQLSIFNSQLSIVRAQQMQMPPVPLDPAVKVGKLENGLTYFIRHNEWPEKRCDFYIAQRVGSMQEEDDQRGLAHFLEHMCFNGTTHFPGDALKQYLERIGVKFGENLNAYTSFDETVYNINNVNVEIPGAIDTCLLILHDWSHDLLLEDKEIDKERGVIEEEWRVRRSAQMRLIEAALPTLYKDSKYANRMPIGTMEVVKNFPYETLRNYYHKWYRPDLQALVIVGDVDPDAIERKLQDMFADIAPAPADAAVREEFPVPDNEEPIVFIGKDKEFPDMEANIMFKSEPMPREMRGTYAYLINDFMQEAVAGMLNERLLELTRKADAPFTGAGVSFGDYVVAKTKDALSLDVSMKENRYTEGIKAAYRELLRSVRGGFTESEYERFKQEYLSQLDAAYEARDKRTNTSFVYALVNHFLNNDPAADIAWSHQTLHQIVPMIPLQSINQAIGALAPNNRAILVLMPDKEGLACPTEQDILSAMAEVDAEEIAAFTEEINTDPLVPELHSKVKVKKITDDIYDSKLITLSNGMKIHVKQTDYSPGKIIFRATSWGGNSLYSNDEYINSGNVGLVRQGGLGSFSAVELNKKLAGIQASATATVGSRTEGITGHCVKKDLESMLQLTYLCFTSPRRDDDAFTSQMERRRNALKNQELDPRTTLSDSIISVVYDNNVRAKREKEEDLDRINYDRLLQIYRERYSNAGDFEFYLVGDVNADSVAPLLAKYLGALPTKGKKENYKTIDQRIHKGQRECFFTREQDTPNSLNVFLYHAPVKETLKNDILVDMLQQALTMLYTETVREDEGGAYGVPVNAGISDYPEEIATVQIILPTSPEKRQAMTGIVYDGVKQMQDNGPTESNLGKIKEYMLRSHQENLKDNDYWMESMISKTRYNQDFVTGYEDCVQSISTEDIKNMARHIFGAGNKLVVTMETPQ
ncbi:MAG: insulinase family protein [Bacteroidaceae bacterium]|nr:insulinase family protein [Bacteroidaceae bacterium]